MWSAWKAICYVSNWRILEYSRNLFPFFFKTSKTETAKLGRDSWFQISNFEIRQIAFLMTCRPQLLWNWQIIVWNKTPVVWLRPDLYASALICDWNQISALNIIQNLSISSSFYFVIFVSASKLFKNVNLQSYMITKRQ